MKRIVFPEGENDFIKEAMGRVGEICEPILLSNDLAGAAEMVAGGQADAMVAGIDYASRDVILAARDKIGLSDGWKTFSSLFVCDMPDGKRYIVADGATCKNPTAEQLADIVLLVSEAAEKLLDDKPRVAMLSFSTFGSGGKDPSMDKIAETIQIVRGKNPDVLVDGEMQLDAAINPRVAAKKAPAESEVAGRANVLIAPDINSGNILYKATWQLAGADVAGPILLGFKAPVSDLSRGSTVEDVILTVKSVIALA
ncbi:MAG: phosphate acetyltransferase [Candidatus Nomurabacteria bacterium]|jgi:phosphate acetyltransferase|nr:phosphate acetyltransferase [Candidatus Nomurabacteria bacterium]